MTVLDSTRVGMAALVLAMIGSCAHSGERSQLDPSPGVSGAQSGLELQWWRVDDRNNALGRTLARYADRPVPMHESVRTLWQENGLRVVSVPIDELTALRTDMWRQARNQRQNDQLDGVFRGGSSDRTGLTRVHDEWLGQRPRWTEIASGPVMPSGAVLALDSGRVRLGPGRVRLLARCWTIPLTGLSSRVPAGLRVELALQWADMAPRRSSQPTLDKVSIARAAQDEGLIFTRFVAEMIAVDGEALVIVTESPNARWDSGVTPPMRLPAGTIPTIGRALLGDAGGGNLSQAKVVLALMPQIPQDYELIGR
jgi:hypothetical protein